MRAPAPVAADGRLPPHPPRDNRAAALGEGGRDVSDLVTPATPAGEAAAAARAPAAAGPARAGRVRAPWGEVILLAALSMLGSVAMDMYLPALPRMSAELRASPRMAQLTITAFLFGLAGGQLLLGPLSDRWGRRPPLMAGTVLFLVATAACAVAPSVEVLAAARVLQALGACAGMVISRAVVRDRYDDHEVLHVYALLGLVFTLAPVLAPLVGGWVLAAADWRAIFGVQVGFAVVVALLAALRLKESRSEATRARRGWSSRARLFRGRPCSLTLGAVRLPHRRRLRGRRLWRKVHIRNPAVGALERYPARVEELDAPRRGQHRRAVSSVHHSRLPRVHCQSQPGVECIAEHEHLVEANHRAHLEPGAQPCQAVVRPHLCTQPGQCMDVPYAYALAKSVCARHTAHLRRDPTRHHWQREAGRRQGSCGRHCSTNADPQHRTAPGERAHIPLPGLGVIRD